MGGEVESLLLDDGLVVWANRHADVFGLTVRGPFVLLRDGPSSVTDEDVERYLSHLG